MSYSRRTGIMVFWVLVDNFCSTVHLFVSTSGEQWTDKTALLS